MGAAAAEAAERDQEPEKQANKRKSISRDGSSSPWSPISGARVLAAR